MKGMERWGREAKARGNQEEGAKEGGWMEGNGKAVNGRQATRRIAREKRNDGVVSGRWKAEGFDAGGRRGRGSRAL